MTEEREVAEFYASIQYPGPDAVVRYNWANRLKEYYGDKPFKFLDAGCGAGRHTAGVLLTFPGSTGVGMDISGPSIKQAEILLGAKNLGERVNFVQASFSEPLSFENDFDLVLAIGSIHHTPNPTESFENLSRVIKPGGMLAGMVYGKRAKQRRYDIKEMLFAVAKDDVNGMRLLFNAYMRKYGGVYDMTLREITRELKIRLSKMAQKLTGREGHSGQAMDKDSEVYFMDEYVNPIDVAFDSVQLKKIFSDCGLELVKMYTCGRFDEKLFPQEWIGRWECLDTWSRVRVSELMDPLPSSFSFVARKI